MTCCVFSDVTADIILSAVTRPECGREKIAYRADTAHSLTKIFSSRDTSLLNKHMFVPYIKCTVFLHFCHPLMTNTLYIYSTVSRELNKLKILSEDEKVVEAIIRAKAYLYLQHLPCTFQTDIQC